METKEQRHFSQWEKYKPYVEQLSHVNNSCVFVIDLVMGRFVYTSPNFVTFFGYDTEKILDPSIEANYIESRIHPDDHLIFSAIQKKLMEFLSNLPVNQGGDYKHIFEFRVLNVENKYVRVISQHQVLEINENGQVLYVLGVIDLSPDQTKYEGVKFRLLNFKTGETLSLDTNENNKTNLSKREIEILQMVNVGMLSKEISEKLSISIHTVNRHRQNILEKMAVDNTLEAINYARKLGLLD